MRGFRSGRTGARHFDQRQINGATHQDQGDRRDCLWQVGRHPWQIFMPHKIINTSVLLNSTE